MGNGSSEAVTWDPRVTRPIIDVYVVGDSYSAGNGAGRYYDDQEYYRSRNAWGELLAKAIRGAGVQRAVVNYKSLAISGTTTAEIVDQVYGGNGDPNNVRGVPPEADVVLFTAGGNDLHFPDVVTRCYALRSGAECANELRAATSRFDGAIAGTEGILRALEQRRHRGARVVLMGYPQLSTAGEDVLAWVRVINDRPLEYEHLAMDVSREIRRLGMEYAQRQRRLVDEWNARHELQVTYAGSVPQTFAGHEPDPQLSERNPYRWINELFETEGRRSANGTTQSTLSLNKKYFYHPNMIGHEVLAKLAYAAIDGYGGARSTTDKVDLELYFVVDTSQANYAIC
jgi:lysophospholipase L1-like esterase